MTGSIKIFTWFKIPVYIHWTFSLLILFVVWQGLNEGQTIPEILFSTSIIIILFGCVLLHEFGHSLMARRYNIGTQDIILTPIGGIARLEKMPDNPKQELLVAVAGPMVNVVIAALLLAAVVILTINNEIGWWYFQNYVEWLGSSWFAVSASDSADLADTLQNAQTAVPFWLTAVTMVFFLNLVMVVFNLIPAFPMDGGRVFRALLAMKTNRLFATRVAARTGQSIAILFVLIGLFYNEHLPLALIGFFVFTTARTEYGMVRLEETLKSYKAADVLRSQFTELLVNDWMQTPVELLTRTNERNFLVFNLEHQPAGYLSEHEVIDAAKKNAVSTTVETWMKQPFTTVTETESLRYIYYLIFQRNISIVAVTNHEGTITGVIDQTGVENFMRLKN